MQSVTDTFGGPLRADPALRLAEPVVPTLKTGPLAKVQFVVEFTGPRTVLASSAEVLLRADWQKALAQPQCWAMAPGDSHWRLLGSNRATSFDSLAIAWDMFVGTTRLSGASASELLRASEGFAAQIGRRASAIPSLEQLDRLIGHWSVVRQNLDIGFSIGVLSGASIPEREIWRLCSAMGLQFGPQGSFDWMVEDWPTPLLSVTPLEEDQFSLGAVQLDVAHTGVSIGFNIPRNPTPSESFEAVLRVASQFVSKFDCKIYSESMEILPDAEIPKLRENLAQAIELIEKAGLKPGCAEAVRLFSL